MTHVIGVQRVAQLQAVGVGGGSHADVGRDLGYGVCSLTIYAPAPGNKGGAVRGVIHRGGRTIRGPGGVEHTASGIGGGEEILDGYVVSDVRAGVDGLTVGDTVCTAGVECIIIIPAVYSGFSCPGQIVKIVRPGHDIVLRCGSGMGFLLCDDGHSRQQAQNQDNA